MVDKEKILQELNSYFVAYSIIEDKKYDFDSQGRLNVYSDIRPSQYRFPNGSLPFAFGKVVGTFNVRDSNLSSLYGCPGEVTGDCLVDRNKLSDLRGAPDTVGGVFNISLMPRLQSLEGFPASVEAVIFTWSSTLPVLRLLNACRIGIAYGNTNAIENRAAEKVKDILRRYAGQGKRAMFDAQKELEDAGFEKNARW
jgi:hypothetical protein